MSKHHHRRPKGVLYTVREAAEAILHTMEEVLEGMIPRHPQPPRNFTVVFLGSNEMSKIAKVQLAWTPSVSPDVLKQILTVVIGAAEPIVTELAASVATAGTFDVPEETAVHVELVAVDEAGASEKAVLDFQIGDLTVPEAPTGLAYSIVEVIDVPAPEVVPVVETPVAPVDAAPAPEQVQ